MEKRYGVYLFFMRKHRIPGNGNVKKGQKKRKWTVEQKLEIVRKHLDDNSSVCILAKEYGADTGMICRWTKEYLAEGETGLQPKARPGINTQRYIEARICQN